MLRKLFNEVSSIYNTIVTPFRVPWGFSSPVDNHQAYLLTQNAFVKGDVRYYNCNLELERQSLFDCIRFVDIYEEEEREVICKNYDFYILLSSITEISMYLKVDDVASPDKHIDLEDPVLQEVLTTTDSASFTEGSEGGGCRSQPVDGSPISIDDLIFCKVALTIKRDEEPSDWEPSWYRRMALSSTILYDFCLAMSKIRCLTLVKQIQALAPNVCIRKKSSDKKSQQSLSNSSHALSVNVDSYRHLIDSVVGTSSVFTNESFNQLLFHLPQRNKVQDIQLVYSTQEHGISMKTFYRRSFQMAEDDDFVQTCLLVIKDSNYKIFGALLTELPHISSFHYGTGECFVFNYTKGHLNVYKWSQKNELFIIGDVTHFSVGSDEGNNAIWIDDRFQNGFSHPCGTFDSPSLSSVPDFICLTLELWAFVRN